MRAWQPVEQLLHESVGSVFPAAQVVVVEGGEIMFALAVGAANEATIFDLASLTKPLVTVSLIAQLCEHGGIALDDAMEIAAGRCTVRALLSHSTGLPAWRALGDPHHPNRETVIANVHATPFAYEPGTKSVYSDLGFILLTQLVEQHLGPLDAAFASRIATPLDLDLGYHPDPNFCAPTTDTRRGLVNDDNAFAMGGVAGHAGLFGTAHDVSRYVQHLLSVWHGTPGLVRPATLRQFWSSANIPGSTWCLGWDRPSAHGSSAGTRWPRTGVGHLGFTGTSIWIDPPRRRSVVLLSNRVYPSVTNERIKQLRPQLHDLIVNVLDD